MTAQSSKHLSGYKGPESISVRCGPNREECHCFTFGNNIPRCIGKQREGSKDTGSEPQQPIHKSLLFSCAKVPFPAPETCHAGDYIHLLCMEMVNDKTH